MCRKKPGCLCIGAPEPGGGGHGVGYGLHRNKQTEIQGTRKKTLHNEESRKGTTLMGSMFMSEETDIKALGERGGKEQQEI